MEITLLDNKKSIANLVEVDINQSIVEFIEKELQTDGYNFIVTADNLAFAKTKMADLNKSIKFIDTFRKDKVSAESVAIDIFKVNVKKYVALIDSKREEIKKNVEVFEKETKDNILKELSLYCEQLVKEQNIRDNFLAVDIVDLIVLGSVTAKGALTKKAKETVESRVNVCKAKQDKYDMRLMQLENLSYQNGLATPLTITHIQGIILLDSDDEYNIKLNELIASEMNRQNTIKENLQKEADEKAEKGAQQKVINEQNRIKSIFAVNLGDLDNTDYYIANLSAINDFSEYGDFADFARSFVGEQISRLNFHRNDLLKKANDLLAEMESNQKPEVEIVHETIPSTQEEKHQQVKENQNVEDDKKVVYIDVKLQFKVKKTVASDRILDKVNQMLADAGFSESILSVEVV